jgi:hypothetical protein
MIPTKKPLQRLFVLGACAALGLFFGGCAAPSNSANMAAKLAAPVAKHPESVTVAVTGGSETSKMGASKISDADFADAIRASITQTGLFARIAEAGKGDFNLDVQIVRLDQPTFGASFTVNIETTWRLVRQRDQSVIWQKAVMSSFTATMGDAFAGVTRLRLANEGAARKNIEDALTQLSAVNLN